MQHQTMYKSMMQGYFLVSICIAIENHCKNLFIAAFSKWFKKLLEMVYFLKVEVLVFADVAELVDAHVSGTCGLVLWEFKSPHPH